MKKKLISTSIFFMFSVILLAQTKVKVFYTKLNQGQNIKDNPVKEYQFQTAGEIKNKIKIYPNLEFQTLEGIGGAFNEIGGEALMSLPKDMQDEVMQKLFSAEEAGFSFCRTAVGSSDFGIDAYSYSEVADDYKMKHFSVKREENTVIPYIQKAFKYNPNLKLFASPWSPPAWMKYSGFMDRGIEFPEKNYLKDEEKIYQAYAIYFSKYIQAYAKRGIEIDRLIVQNENDISTKYPSCVMPVEQMTNFVQKYLRPQFDLDKIDTEIWAGTFRTYGQLDALELAVNEKYREQFDGIGIQYTNPLHIKDMTDLWPEAPFMHTEGNCYNGTNNENQASKRLREVASYINYGSPNYCYWNMILNETGKSGWDWRQNALINIDRDSKEVTYNPDYYAISFMSKYLTPGTVRVASYAKETVISVKKGNKIMVLIQNDKEDPMSYDCQIENQKSVLVEIPGESLSAMVFEL